MIEPITPSLQTRLVNNIVSACKVDIELLSKPAYNFISGCAGFIAHYNHQGFIAAYGTGTNLALDILMNKRYNQYSNFRPGESDYEYYMSKRDLYNKVVKELENAYTTQRDYDLV
jgi:hypothetical protein